MSSFRFVHAADLHLDTPFEGLARLGEAVPAVLRDASLRAFDNLVALTLDCDAAFLLLAGDIYDGPERGVRAQLRFHDGLRRLERAGTAVFVVQGNHDPLEEGWSAIKSWPENVTLFAPDAVQSVPVEIAGRQVATVHGISYRRRETRDNLAHLFPTTRAAGLNIGLLHANVGGQAEHDSYAPCSLDDLRAAAIDYWALGHIHRHAVLHRPQPFVVYPGALQGRSPKPTETGAKGAVVVEVANGVVQDLTFHPLDAARFELQVLDVAAIQDLAQLRDALERMAEEVVRGAEGRPVILRAELVGRSPLHRALRRSETTTDDLLAELRAAGGTDAGLWWDRLTLSTALPIDRDAIADRGDFSAELIARARACAATPDALAAFLAEHAAPADGRLRGLIGELAPHEADRLLDAALDEALARIEPEDEP